MKKFLVIQTAFIGDVILMTSILEKIHETFPKAEIHVLVKEENVGLFERHPYISHKWTLNKKSKIKSIFKLIRELRTIHFDYIINCHRFLSSGLITFLSKGSCKIGFNKNPLSIFYNIKAPHTIDAKGKLHEIERNHGLISSFTDHRTLPPKLYPSDADYNNIPNEKYICMAPGSIWMTKQLPEEKWLELIQKINLNTNIFLLGSKNEDELNEGLILKSERKNIFNKAGN